MKTGKYKISNMIDLVFTTINDLAAWHTDTNAEDILVTGDSQYIYVLIEDREPIKLLVKELLKYRNSAQGFINYLREKALKELNYVGTNSSTNSGATDIRKMCVIIKSAESSAG